MVKKKIKKAIRTKVKNKKTIKSKKINKEGKPIGKVTHYFSNIKVAVIKLSNPVKKGDTIRIIGGEATDFKQKIKSMQINYKEVKLAKKGASIGLKIDEKVHDGYKVFKP